MSFKKFFSFFYRVSTFRSPTCGSPIGFAVARGGAIGDGAIVRRSYWTKILSYLTMPTMQYSLYPRVSERELRPHCHFRSLHFAEMLLHVATVAVLVNIAIIELDYLYSLPPKNDSDVDFLLAEVTSGRLSVTKYDTRREFMLFNTHFCKSTVSL